MSVIIIVPWQRVAQLCLTNIDVNACRAIAYKFRPEAYGQDGLNSIKYKIHKYEEKPLYSWLLVEPGKKSCPNLAALKVGSLTCKLDLEQFASYTYTYLVTAQAYQQYCWFMLYLIGMPTILKITLTKPDGIYVIPHFIILIIDYQLKLLHRFNCVVPRRSGLFCSCELIFTGLVGFFLSI